MALILDRLQRELNVTTDAIARGEIVAQQAIYFARIGRFEEAKRLVFDLRKIFGDGHSGSVTVWIMLAESLIHHCSELSPEALDRVVRAQFLSKLMRHRFLEVLTSAWRAEIEFEDSKFLESFASLEIVLNSADVADNAALTRACIIVCKAAFLVGEKALAQRCFIAGRAHALSSGDQASIEAIQYNRAAFRLGRFRSEKYLGVEKSNELKEIRTEVNSAKSLQYLTRIEAFSAYIDLIEARLLTLEGRYAEAIAKFENLRCVGPFPVGSHSQHILDLEISYCLCQMNEFSESLKLFEASVALNTSTLDADDLLAVRWMQRELAKCDVRYKKENADSNILYGESVAFYKEMISVIVTGLDKVSSKLISVGI